MGTGINIVGQLGDGTLVNKSMPIQVMTDVLQLQQLVFITFS